MRAVRSYDHFFWVWVVDVGGGVWFGFVRRSRVAIHRSTPPRNPQHGFIPPVAPQLPGSSPQSHHSFPEGNRRDVSLLIPSPQSHHSFPEGNLRDVSLFFWTASGATIPLAKAVRLFPDSADRYGYLWNSEAIVTPDFEVDFVVSAKGTKETVNGAGFGFFLSHTNPSVTVADKVKAADNYGRAMEESG